MKNLTIGSIFKPIGRAFSRFHFTLFIVVVVAGLGYAVILLNDLLTSSSTNDGYVSPIDAGSIDQTTLDRIKALHTSDKTSPDKTLPDGRINPLGE